MGFYLFDIIDALHGRIVADATVISTIGAANVWKWRATNDYDSIPAKPFVNILPAETGGEDRLEKPVGTGRYDAPIWVEVVQVEDPSTPLNLSAGAEAVLKAFKGSDGGELSSESSIPAGDKVTFSRPGNTNAVEVFIDPSQKVRILRWTLNYFYIESNQII